MSEGISLKNLRQFFEYTEQAMKDNKTVVYIDNEMCRFLYAYLKDIDSYFNTQDKEIERLNNIINELEKYLKEQIQKSWEIEEQCYENIYNELQELKENNNE